MGRRMREPPTTKTDSNNTQPHRIVQVFISHRPSIRLITNRGWKNYSAILFALVFAIWGVYALLHSFAEAAVTPSPSGTIVLNNSGKVIINSYGNKWTVTNGVVYKNGSKAHYTAKVTEIAYINAIVWQESNLSRWWKWTNTGWVRGNNPIEAIGSTLPACTQSGQTMITGATNTTIRATINASAGSNMEPTIQNAINAASSAGGGIVKLGAGTYELEARLSMASNVELAGSGEDSTTLQAENANIGIVTTNGASNTTMGGFTADQNGQNLNSISGGGNPSDYEVDVNGGTNNIIEQVQLINPINYMLDEENNATAFCMRSNTVIVNGSESKYSDNTYANLDGIHIDGGNNGDILNNYIDERENGATDGDDALVAQSYLANQSYIEYMGNIARGGNNGDCLQFAVGPDSISHDTVAGNELYGCPFGIRTGGYNSGGTITSTIITDNNIHNLVPGSGKNGSFPDGGNAIDLGGFLASGQSSNGNTVTKSYICDAGNVVAETGVTASGTTIYTSCTDSATALIPPPLIP
jgi:hypothetical protein